MWMLWRRTDVKINRLVAGALAGVALIGAALAVTGFVSAQEGGGAQDDQRTQRQERRGAYLERVAANLGVTVDQLKQAHKDAALQGVDEALANGRITEEQAAKMRERIESGEGAGRFHRKHDRVERAKHVLRGIVGSAAGALGIEASALRDELKAGKSIADVASERGVPLDDVKAQITSDAQAKLAERVADGKITKEQADAALQRLTDRLDELLARSRQPS
jgi:uncharacterized membrane protein